MDINSLLRGNGWWMVNLSVSFETSLAPIHMLFWRLKCNSAKFLKVTCQFGARRHAQYPSAQRTVDESAPMPPYDFIANINTCSMVISLHTPAQNLALRLMVKLPDEQNSWNSSCVILFSKSDINFGGRGEHILRMLKWPAARKWGIISRTVSRCNVQCPHRSARINQRISVIWWYYWIHSFAVRLLLASKLHLSSYPLWLAIAYRSVYAPQCITMEQEMSVNYQNPHSLLVDIFVHNEHQHSWKTKSQSSGIEHFFVGLSS